MTKRVRPYFIYNGGGLTGSDYYWLQTLKRSSTPGVPLGWKHWQWQFVRPNYAWLSFRGWICFREEDLPVGYEKVPVVMMPVPDDVFDHEDNFPCVEPSCAC